MGIGFFQRHFCIKQNSEKDNILACLVTYFKQIKVSFSINTLKELLKNQNGKGSDIIADVVEKMGYSIKIVNLDDKNEINGLLTPFIAEISVSFGKTRFVVVHQIHQHKMLVADPAEGLLKYQTGKFLKIWTGLNFLISPTERIKSEKNNKLFWRFLEIMIPFKNYFITLIISSILFTILGISASFYFQILIDEILQYSLLNTLQVVSIGIIIITVFRFLLMAFKNQLGNYLSQKLDILIMFGYFSRLLGMPLELFHKYKTGELTSRFFDAYNVREVLANTAISFVINLLMAVCGGIILYIQSPILFCVALVVVFCYGFLAYILNNVFSALNQNIMETNAQFNSIMVESISGIDTIKALNAEREIGQIGETRFIKNIKNHFKFGSTINIQSSLIFLIYTVGNTVIIWIGALMILKNKMTIGQLMTFTALMQFFLDPLRSLLESQTQIQTSIVAAKRLLQVYDHEIEKNATENYKMKPDRFEGKIHFNNVSFSYDPGSPLVLKDINLAINPGERIALVGESGSGKTTLVKLLLHFYSINSGSINIDGMNINDISLDSLRERVSYVSQETFLFSGTIKSNLLMGRPESTVEEVIEAAKIAQTNDFISGLPLRYETLLTENGSNLSGGQRQRLAITRALVKKPDILILDEATSNLDSITEKAIETTINEFTNNITTIIIAHRLSTIRKCDTIYVMEKGRIVEHGSHQELLNNKERYYHLWKEQLPSIDK